MCETQYDQPSCRAAGALTRHEPFINQNPACCAYPCKDSH